MLNQLKRITAKSYIHGVKELVSTSNRTQHRYTVVLLLCVVLFAISLVAPARCLFSDELRSINRPVIPERFPAVTVCPLFRNLKSPYTLKERQVYEYLSGYLFSAWGSYLTWRTLSFGLNGGVPSRYRPNVTQQEMSSFLANYNYSLEAAFKDVAMPMSHIFPWIEARPANSVINIQPILLLQGLCYVVSMERPISSYMMTEVSLSLQLREEIDENFSSFFPSAYSLYVGDESDNGVVAPGRAKIPVSVGDVFDIVVVSKELKMYPGRYNLFCSESLDVAEARYTGSLKNVERFCGGRCMDYVPPSPNQQEVQRENYCNVFEWNSCMLQRGQDADLREEVLSEATMPCHVRSYETRIRKKRANRTVVTYRLGSASDFELMEEFPICSKVDFLASVGGAASVCFGASFVAGFQILLAGILANIKAENSRSVNNQA